MYEMIFLSIVMNHIDIYVFIRMVHNNKAFNVMIILMESLHHEWTAELLRWMTYRFSAGARDAI